MAFPPMTADPLSGALWPHMTPGAGRPGAFDPRRVDIRAGQGKRTRAAPVMAMARHSGHGVLPPRSHPLRKARIAPQLALAAGCKPPQIEALFDF